MRRVEQTGKMRRCHFSGGDAARRRDEAANEAMALRAGQASNHRLAVALQLKWPQRQKLLLYCVVLVPVGRGVIIFASTGRVLRSSSRLLCVLRHARNKINAQKSTACT